MRVEHDEAVGDLHEDVVAAGGVGHHFLDATFHYSEPERSVGGPDVSTRPLARGTGGLTCILAVRPPSLLRAAVCAACVQRKRTILLVREDVWIAAPASRQRAACPPLLRAGVRQLSP